MIVLLIINDAPYGTEKAYNAMRLAMTIQREHSGMEIRVFLMGDAVTCALPNQQTPQGYYNIERMLRAVIDKGGLVKACGTCSTSRGIDKLPLIEGVEVSTMGMLSQWVSESDRIVAF